VPRRPRRNHAPAFKAKVALEAIKGEEPHIVIAERLDVHPNQITKWKRQLFDGAASSPWRTIFYPVRSGVCTARAQSDDYEDRRAAYNAPGLSP
jgi:transposase-like protein